MLQSCLVLEKCLKYKKLEKHSNKKRTVELFQTCVKQAASIKVLIRKVVTDKSLEGKEVTHDTQYHLLHCHLPDEPFLLRLVFYSADQCFLVFDQPTKNTMTPFSCIYYSPLRPIYGEEDPCTVQHLACVPLLPILSGQPSEDFLCS